MGRPEGDPRPVALRVNNAYGLRRAVQAGVGIASLADYIVAADMNLVQIDLPVETPEFDTYFVYPEELKDTKRVTVFRDFIVSKAQGVEFLRLAIVSGYLHSNGAIEATSNSAMVMLKARR